jgi:hypothetical protein
MPQEISRPSSSVRIHAGAPAMRLTYAISVKPSPLTVSLPGTDPTLGSLVVVITNSTEADVQVQNITFYVPVGGSSTTLTPSSAGIQAAVSDPVHWVFSGPSSPVSSGTADYVLGPATGTSVTLAAGTSVVVQLDEIRTNTSPGTATIAIKEMIADTTPTFGGFSVTTFPYGFYFESLAATMLVKSALVPVSQVAYGSQVTLIWNSSVVDTAAYQIYYSTPQGQQLATPTSYDQWLSPPLHSDTVFTVVVTAAVEGGHPITASLSTLVAATQPDLVVNTVAAKSISSAGAVTAASVQSPGETLLALNPLGGNIGITGNLGIGGDPESYPLRVAAGKMLRIEGGTSSTDTADYFSFGGNGSFGIDAPGVPDGRFVVQNSGNVGIGTNTPGFPLSFPDTLGDKISLYGQSGAHYGLGIQGALLQIHTSGADGDIAFGYGKSDSLTETMRMRGNGNLSVGDGLFLLGRPDGTASLTKNAFNTPGGPWQIYDPTKKAFTVELRDSGMLELYGTQTNGQADWLKMATFDAVNNYIAFYTPLYVQGALNYYWAPDGLWKNINNRAGDWAGSNTTGGPPSDVRLKTELRPIPSALEKVSQLRGVTFRWNEQGLQYLTRDIPTTVSAGPGASDEENRKVWQAERDKRHKDLSKTSVGVVAQDVEAVLPEAVTADETGYKSVKYYELIPLVIEALKEQNKVSQEQAQTIARQQAEIQRLTVANQATLQQLKELQEVRQKLGLLEATVNKFLASGLSGDHDELISAGWVPAAVHSSNPK